jgi:outer membrane protein OmpA-like peptidoglycan-associated protein
VNVFDDRPPPSDYLGITGGHDPASEEFAQLRELLLGEERRQLAELKVRLETRGLTPEEVAEQLPAAIALRAGRDRQLAKALAPTVESAISVSVRRNPREIATAIFPVLGPAIRKAMAETMAGLVSSINRAVEQSFSLRGIRWRLEAWRTGVPYARILLRHALVYRVEQVFLIHSETGLLLAHAAPPELKVTDADLISGMLTAIQDFVADSFAEQESGGLRTFSVGELTVMVERGPQAVLAAVVRGQPPDSLLRTLQDSLESVHFQFAGAFADFTGDATPFAPAQPLLEDCLQTVLSTDMPRGSQGHGAWLRWAIPILLLAVIWGGLAWRGHRRWTAAVDRLKVEPGIEVVEARRSGGRWHFRGLRDPLAADPATLLAGMKANPAKVDAQWKPFLSLEPSIVLERTRRAIAAPATVTLTIREDSVVARGSAPLAWVARALGSFTLPPGVSHLDVSGVEAVLPPALATLRNDAEARLVLFEVGSAALSLTARRTLAEVAGSFERLRVGALDQGYRVDLELIGRTDPTGTDATNQALSRWRVDAARAVLIGLGIPSGELNGIGVGTSRPLPAREGEDQAQVNRSVTFVVHLSPATRGREATR